MHLMFENHFKNKIHMWSGNYKGLSSGQEDCEIEMMVWEQIGCETAGSVPFTFILSAFSHTLPNITMELQYYTAKDLCFWLLHIGPYVLKNQLRSKYYRHFMKLNQIIKLCLCFMVSQSDLNELHELTIEYVQEDKQYMH